MAYSENEIMTMLEKGSSQLYNEDILQLIESKNDTILRQQAEIERLQTELKTAKTEARKELAERLKNKRKLTLWGIHNYNNLFHFIDNVVKETEEEDEG